jgi:methanogenic corrinoid protein MtbC1
MINTSTGATLIGAIGDLQEDMALALVRQRLAAGDDPLLIIEACQEGMRQVGLRYERREYYLAGLIMAGEIFRACFESYVHVQDTQSTKLRPGCEPADAT